MQDFGSGDTSSNLVGGIQTKSWNFFAGICSCLLIFDLFYSMSFLKNLKSYPYSSAGGSFYNNDTKEKSLNPILTEKSG